MTRSGRIPGHAPSVMNLYHDAPMPKRHSAQTHKPHPHDSTDVKNIARRAWSYPANDDHVAGLLAAIKRVRRRTGPDRFCLQGLPLSDNWVSCPRSAARDPLRPVDPARHLRRLSGYNGRSLLPFVRQLQVCFSDVRTSAFANVRSHCGRMRTCDPFRTMIGRPHQRQLPACTGHPRLRAGRPLKPPQAFATR
jgi:hypothetical protein